MYSLHSVCWTLCEYIKSRLMDAFLNYLGRPKKFNNDGSKRFKPPRIS